MRPSYQRAEPAAEPPLPARVIGGDYVVEIEMLTDGRAQCMLYRRHRTGLRFMGRKLAASEVDAVAKGRRVIRNLTAEDAGPGL